MATFLLLAACAADDDTLTRKVRRARPDEAADTDTAGDTADDTAGPDTAADTGADTATEDSGDPAPAAGWACYLGEARDGNTCLATYAPADPGADYAYADPYDGSAQYLAPVAWLDLDAEDPATALAPNFVLEELAEAWKGRWAVVQPHLIDRLQELRDELGQALVVTSGYRSPEYNASVGGVSYSRHQYGDAADLDADGWTVEELGELCEAADADYVGLYEDGHTHCDWRDAPLDPAFFPSAARAAPAPAPAEAARLDRAGDVWTAPATGFDEGEPLRRWRAWDADGALIAEGTGRAWTPPPMAARVGVVVGGRLRLEAAAR